MEYLIATRDSVRPVRLFLGHFRRDRLGVTALEYGIIASILGLVLVGIFKQFGTTLSSLFTHVGTAI
jgi:Flp pilus assembly pilin Flp